MSPRVSTVTRIEARASITRPAATPTISSHHAPVRAPATVIAATRLGTDHHHQAAPQVAHPHRLLVRAEAHGGPARQRGAVRRRVVGSPPQHQPAGAERHRQHQHDRCRPPPGQGGVVPAGGVDVGEEHQQVHGTEEQGHRQGERRSRPQRRPVSAHPQAGRGAGRHEGERQAGGQPLVGGEAHRAVGGTTGAPVGGQRVGEPPVQRGGEHPGGDDRQYRYGECHRDPADTHPAGDLHDSLLLISSAASSGPIPMCRACLARSSAACSSRPPRRGCGRGRVRPTR